MQKKKGLIIGIGLGIILVAAIVAAILLLGGRKAPLLAWNPDHKAMQDGTMTRVPEEDGYISVRLWLDGQEVTYRTNDLQLIAQLDARRVVQIDADKEGNLTGVSAPAYTELANRDLVQQLEGDTLLLNSSIAFNGSQKTLTLAKNCKITNVSTGEVSSTQLQIMDEVLVYGNEKGEVTHIFVLHRERPAKLYWRLERKYDSKTKGTSRQPDENGVYTILFAADGTQTELKCKEKELVDRIDAPSANAGAMGLCLDGEGYITDLQDVYKTVRGKEVCSLYDVQTVENGSFLAMNKQDGNTYGKSMEAQLSPDCEIYDVSNGAILKGQQVESLQPGDRITAYSDAMGLVRYVFVHVRLVESRVYFNLERMYQGSDTTRQPDENGFYVFQMVCDGQVLTLKTQDRTVAKKVDSISSRGMGLILDGDVILRAFGADCVLGYGSLISGRYVRDITGALATTTSTATSTKATPLMLNKDLKVYDVTGNPGTTLGAETQLQEGDRIQAFGNADQEATHIFVLQRPVAEN